MILLLGVITVGAVLVVAAGGMALQSFQENAEGGLAEDTAVQAHASLAEAASTGTPQSVPVGEGAVDSRLVDGGTLTISMYDSSGTCSAEVEEELGALQYEGGDRTMIYEGGAIWVETEAGLGIERAPPISHSAEATRVSVLSVAAATIDDGGGLVARPNESARQHVARQTEELLTRCPANGYTSLRINVTSPYADGWDRHFREAVETTANVDVNRSGDAVVANISNATAAISTDGLGLASVDAPLALAPGDHFPVEVGVGNDDFDATDATVELDVDNTTIARSNTVNVSGFGVATTRFNVTPAVVDAQLTTGATHNYTVRLLAANGTVVNSTTGAVSYGATAPQVTLDGVADGLDPADRQLTINATLHNYGLLNGTGNATLELTDPALSVPPQTSPDVDVAAGGSTTIGFDLNVSELAAGVYDYAVVGPDGTRISDSFEITSRSGGGIVVGDLRLRSVDVSDTMVETGEGFDATLEAENLANASTTGTATLDVSGLSPVDRTVTLSGGEVRDVTLTLPASDVDSLEAGEVHDYTVELASDGETESVSGSFYLGHGGAALGVDDVTATESDGTTVVDATLSNDGFAAGVDNATLSLTDEDGYDVVFGSQPTRTLNLTPGQTGTVTFELNTSALGGNFTAEVTYGGDSGTDDLSFDAIDVGDGNVSFSAAGTGTVRVLGTELASTETWPWMDDRKYWWPVSMGIERTTGGTDYSHQFENDATTHPGDIHDDRNLNSWDTQEHIFSQNWTQAADETTTLTVSATTWAPNDPDLYHQVNTRSTTSGMIDDYHPVADAWDDPYNEINAREGDNPSNVRVLLDGDHVPNVDAANDIQRSAAEVLNQGASDRVNPDGTLTLGPNEAIFLFELSVEGASWDDADDYGDPDYNDAIVLVEFDPSTDATVPVEMDVTNDGSGLTIGTPGVSSPENGNVSMSGTSVDEGEGSTPGSEPDVGGTDPTGPSGPDDVEIEIDVVQLD